MRISDWSSDVCSSDLTGQDRDQQVSGIGQRSRGHRADQPVAGNPAEIAGHEGNYEDAEDVEAAIDRGNRAADRENEGAPQVKKTHEGFNGDHDSSPRKSITRRQIGRENFGTPVTNAHLV